MKPPLTNLRNSAVSDLAAAAAYGIGNAANVQGSPIAVGTPGYWLAHAALGCAASAAEGTGCAGGAIGGAVSAGLNPIIDAKGDIPAAALTAIETMVSGSIAGAFGFNVQGSMTAAQNETLNNWLNHVRTNPMFYSEQERYNNAVAAGDRSTVASLDALSQQRDADLASACAGGFGSAACQTQVIAALAGGNNVQFLNGTAYAFDPNGPAITASGAQPSPMAAATLNNMLGSPFAAIIGGAMYATGSPTNAYYGSQLGVALDGIAAGLAGWQPAKAPRTQSYASPGSGDAAIIADGPISTYDTSITKRGSEYLNVETNVTADQFQANLISNGYSVMSQGVNKNGPFTVLNNGASTYTVYTRTTTGKAGAQYFGPGGVSAKISFKPQ